MSNEKLNLLGVPVEAPKEQFSVTANTDNVLMSDVLKGEVPEIEGDQVEQMAAKYIIAVVHVAPQRLSATRGEGVFVMTGTLRSIMCDDATIEIEMNTDLNDAMSFVNSYAERNPDTALVVAGLDLHQGVNVTEFKGRCDIVACRLLEIDYARTMTTLLLQLKRVTD